jgi:hypothetical protein
MKKYGFWPLVFITSLAIALLLAAATYRINFWPTDSEMAYIPSATQVFRKPFISDLHHVTLIPFYIMHGKETLVVAIGILQRILNDYESLFPNILVLILATMGSSLLVFAIFRRWLNESVAFWGFMIFITTFWTYQYILQGAHQPLVMFTCLLTAYLMMSVDGRRRTYIGTGLALGLMLFSSPTAVVYGPYLLAAFIYGQRTLHPDASWKTWLQPAAWIAFGTITVILTFTLPDPVENWRAFMLFVHDCQQANHFQVIERITGADLPKRGAGLSWIIKYFMLIMPVLFPAYLAGMAYLIARGLRKPSLVLGTVIALSLSTPALVEIVGVAQFGRNYFSWLLGIILGCTYALYLLEHSETLRKHRKVWNLALLAIFAAHVAFNVRAFLGDILPTRMATTAMYDWFVSHPGPRYAYLLHPHNVNTTNVMNHTSVKKPLRFRQIISISQAQEGYMVVPIHTGKSIFLNCGAPDYSEDPAWLALLNSGQLDRYTITSFPTMAASRYWPQEEEYCSYLDLIQGRITDRDRALGRVWILDAGKLQKEWFKQ